jgi:NAD(P)-dependent dehydrogenase (short-subunit alcohol dehydrogenase family)
MGVGVLSCCPLKRHYREHFPRRKTALATCERSCNGRAQPPAPFEQFSHEQWQELMKTDVDSVFLVGQAVARHMIERQRVTATL